MEHPQHTPRGADRWGSVRRCSGALLLLAIATLLIACGGAGGGPGSAAPATSNTATLTWNPPVTTTNLSGYRVYFGTAAGQYIQPPGQGLSAGTSTTYTLMGLSSGTYYMAVTAFDTSNNESAPSNEVSKAIP